MCSFSPSPPNFIAQNDSRHTTGLFSLMYAGICGNLIRVFSRSSFCFTLHTFTAKQPWIEMLACTRKNCCECKSVLRTDVIQWTLQIVFFLSNVSTLYTSLHHFLWFTFFYLKSSIFCENITYNLLIYLILINYNRSHDEIAGWILHGHILTLITHVGQCTLENMKKMKPKKKITGQHLQQLTGYVWTLRAFSAH